MPYKNAEDRRRRARERRQEKKTKIVKIDTRRRCGHEECRTVLSIYNTEQYCAKHAPIYNRMSKKYY